MKKNLKSPASKIMNKLYKYIFLKKNIKLAKIIFHKFQLNIIPIVNKKFELLDVITLRDILK